MNTLRRRSLIALASSFTPLSWAQPTPYPSKAIHLVVGVGPGGGTDILARLVGEGLSRKFGQPVVVDNRPGADSAIGAEIVAKAPADGYVLMFGGTGPLVCNPAVNPSLSYNPLKDFAPITLIGTVPVVISVRPSLKVTNLRELIKLAKQKPGGLSYGSSSTSFQIAAEIFARKAGVKLLHVPYKGSGLVAQALATGEIDIGFTDVPPVLGLAKAGRVTALAVTSEPRPSDLKNLPLVSEAGLKDYDLTFFFAVAAPVDTPAPIVDKLSAAIGEILNEPTVRARILNMGVLPTPTTPAQMHERMRREITYYSELARAENIRPGQ